MYNTQFAFVGHLNLLLVLFSVLVLHWITSKDNASTSHASQIASIPARNNFKLSPHLGCNQALSDIEIYHQGLREFSKTAGVTTIVTAKDYDDLELDRINSMPPNVVSVETKHTREVIDVRSENESHYSASDVGLQRMKIGSTEDLFGER